MASFRVLQIDHVELLVPDRYEAARWYQRILGLEVVPEYQDWAADPGGPLMISSDDGNTKLALFECAGTRCNQRLQSTAGRRDHEAAAPDSAPLLSSAADAAVVSPTTKCSRDTSRRDPWPSWFF